MLVWNLDKGIWNRLIYYLLKVSNTVRSYFIIPHENEKNGSMWFSQWMPFPVWGIAELATLFGLKWDQRDSRVRQNRCRKRLICAERLQLCITHWSGQKLENYGCDSKERNYTCEVGLHMFLNYFSAGLQNSAWFTVHVSLDSYSLVQ